MIENQLDFEVDLVPDFDTMGYELAGVIEFYEQPDTGEGAYRVMLRATERYKDLEPDDPYTEGHLMALIAHKLLDEYLNSEVQ